MKKPNAATWSSNRDLAAAIFIEMKPMKSDGGGVSGGGTGNASPIRLQKAQRPTDLASFDSSDTWASCNPFPSATDLSTWSPVDPTTGNRSPADAGAGADYNDCSSLRPAKVNIFLA